MSSMMRISASAFQRAQEVNRVAWMHDRRIHFAEHIRHALEDPSEHRAKTWPDAWKRAVEHCKPDNDTMFWIQNSAIALHEKDRSRTDRQVAKTLVISLKRQRTKELKALGVTR